MFPKFEDSNHSAKKKNWKNSRPQLFSSIVAAAQVSAGNNRKTLCENSMKIGVSKTRGTPKWMVYMENPIKMGDLGVPPFKETPVCKFNENDLSCS